MRILPSRFEMVLILLSGVTVTLIYASSWRVPPGHRGVLVLFGAIRPELIPPGLHFAPPWPLGLVRMVPVEPTRQIILERLDSERLGAQPREFLTGDENLLNLSLRIDYRVGDPLEIARTGLDRIDDQLKRLAEASLTSILSNTSVNALLGAGRESVGQQFRDHLQSDSDRLALGVRVTSVHWSEVNPLKEVQESFEAAQSAVNQAAQELSQAKTAAEASRIQTSSEVTAIKAEAQGAAESIKQAASADSRRFLAILKQAKRTGFMQTAKTLWLDTVADVLPSLKSRTLLATDQPVDLTIIRSQIVPESIVKP